METNVIEHMEGPHGIELKEFILNHRDTSMIQHIKE